ncbi:CLUMA_CG020746, isoform A [Clunio marinus]|uniref:CLUMA_CG020746, isoform A n=1 Tax=Clunio marinus TaxID=568069 RepID=A0A1J1J5W7_9DIPT|nr:CLUMA_CG020746, isoform A [Clunio marinus]
MKLRSFNKLFPFGFYRLKELTHYDDINQIHSFVSCDYLKIRKDGIRSSTRMRSGDDERSKRHEAAKIAALRPFFCS